MTEHTVIVVVIVCVAIPLSGAIVTRPVCEQVLASVSGEPCHVAVGGGDVRAPHSKLSLHRPAAFELALAP
jgi:hypothetical protein